jgi:hypothetical protein
MNPGDVLHRAWMAALLLSLASGVGGCFSSVHEYQAAGYASPTRREPGPPIEANRIQSDASQFVVLGVTGNTDYVDQAYASLTSQCAGEIVGINTRYSTKLGFMSYTNEVHMQALCLKN